MGEWSKKIGEYGENIVEKFFTIVGWNDLSKGIDIPCLNESHKNKNGNPRKTHGVDFLYSYTNPLVSGQLNNILISAKYKTSKYPNSSSQKFKEYMDDLIIALECYDGSEIKSNVISSFQTSFVNDIGILIWLNNNPESNDDLISSVSNSRVLDTHTNKVIFILDNKRVVFILEVMKFIKTKSDKYNYSFYYPNTGQNINPITRINDGKILPVEYLNSSIIPIKLVNKNNDKEKSLILATIDNFEEDDLMRLIGLSKDISTELVGEVIIAFHDFDEVKHDLIVTQTKQKFQASEYTKNIKVVNFMNPINAF
ncbi:GapS4a family protein [Flavicella sediminum]|uniref:GapS4a family protein n=1 Tax=Flavicella sediminum TaxID=2585141 RepID=UPI00111FFF31|nr:hypothetical protein [Flavicella sediminum]